LAEVFDEFKLAAIAIGGNIKSSCNLSFTQENAGCVEVWEFDPEGMGSLRLNRIE
jgi:hypothetical protein